MVEGKDFEYVSKVILEIPLTAAAVRINPFTWNNPKIGVSTQQPICTMAEVYILSQTNQKIS
jgi:hypothetical protein